MIEHVPKNKRIIVDKETNDFLIEETKIIGLIYRDRKLRPLGDTVLFQRDLRVQSEGGILLTPNVTQNLEGWVRAVGILPYGTMRRKAEININSRCSLTRWEDTMKEFTYEDGTYIVAQSKDVLFQWED